MHLFAHQTNESIRTPLPHGVEEEIDRLDQLARWMDSKFVLPGTRFRFGLDAILGLIPGVGDGLTTLISFYILWRAHEWDLPFEARLRMGKNILLDALYGSVPVVGDLFDFAYRANSKNLHILRNHIHQTLNNAQPPLRKRA